MEMCSCPTCVNSVRQALKTLVGQDAELPGKDTATRPDKTMGCEARFQQQASSLCSLQLYLNIRQYQGCLLQAFVTQMHGALKAAAPSLAEAAK